MSWVSSLRWSYLQKRLTPFAHKTSTVTALPAGNSLWRTRYRCTSPEPHGGGGLGWPCRLFSYKRCYKRIQEMFFFWGEVIFGSSFDFWGTKWLSVRRPFQGDKIFGFLFLLGLLCILDDFLGISFFWGWSLFFVPMGWKSNDKLRPQRVTRAGMRS